MINLKKSYENGEKTNLKPIGRQYSSLQLRFSEGSGINRHTAGFQTYRSISPVATPQQNFTLVMAIDGFLTTANNSFIDRVRQTDETRLS